MNKYDDNNDNGGILAGLLIQHSDGIAGLGVITESIFAILDPVALEDRWALRKEALDAVIASRQVTEKTAANIWAFAMRDLEKAHPTFIRPEAPKSVNADAVKKAAQRAKPVDPKLEEAMEAVKVIKAAGSAQAKALATEMKDLRAEADRLIKGATLKQAKTMVAAIRKVLVK